MSNPRNIVGSKVDCDHWTVLVPSRGWEPVEDEPLPVVLGLA